MIKEWIRHVVSYRRAAPRAYVLRTDAYFEGLSQDKISRQNPGFLVEGFEEKHDSSERTAQVQKRTEDLAVTYLKKPVPSRNY